MFFLPPGSIFFGKAGEPVNLNDILSGAFGGITINLTLNSILRVAVLLVVGVAVIRLLMKLVNRMLARSKALEALQGYIRSVIRVGLWLLLALMVAESIGIPTASLIALLSVAGLAVSLALQNTLSNVAGGIMLLVSKPFVPGDFVELDGVSGTVAQSGLSYSKFITVDNKEIYIPNSQVSSTTIINYTASGKRRAEITFSASYDAPTQTVKAALQEVVDSIPQILRDPAPEIRLSAYGDSSIQYLVRAWAATSDYWEMYYTLLERTRDAFQRRGIEMTYPHLNVHVVPPDSAPQDQSSAV